MSEIAAVAALSQCLVEWMDSLDDRGYTLPTPKRWVMRENKWRAARHGVDAEIIHGDTGELIGLADAIRLLVEELRPIGDRLGCLKELEHNLAVLDHGPSYLRQRAIVDAGGSLIDVVDSLVTELRTDQPGTG